VILRCETCGSYFSYQSELPEKQGGTQLMRCPNKHYSAFKVVDIRTPAPPLDNAKFIEVDFGDVREEDLVSRELTWVTNQNSTVYDCGFLRAHGVEHHYLPFQSLKTPEEPGLLETLEGMKLELVISPNGIPYYKEVK